MNGHSSDDDSARGEQLEWRHARPHYHHGNLPATLVSAAAALLDERGLEALTLREVAARVGVSHAAPYRHFRDKSAILEAVARQGFRELALQMRHGGRSSRPPPEISDDEGSGLRGGPGAVAQAYLHFATSHPDLYRIMFGMSDELGSGRILPEATSVAPQELATALALTPRGERLGRVEIVRIATVLWAQLHGLATLAINGQLEGPPGAAVAEIEQLGRDGLQWLLCGLGTAPAGAPGSRSQAAARGPERFDRVLPRRQRGTG
ncbi:MAG: helix-turn-helix transcriptional regulator [Deltaproteobacteria bacterium]|nr:helix-turn-helix transcriptional regulator [Deltaproteobacteria bacterium]